ncbi:NAD-dependent epimerase/dehydratase family protein [Paraliomyxa miuraensis]|uniref:NAD-dependent epimerase/dehydratase family protein n=1 Tax=Paraliomyxa miuraensis TaxID=376150 RepID=UPI002256F3AE|nr:NAD-dependent epimerase/dehydratase family protein [Paraliomyxa miuraensis]MCX4243147.1 GDP-mannose 4,6-dehydratase [Paraliomyxa miuraensis]
MSHVLVTGGAGFVGCNLVASLLGDGHTVTVLDSLVRPGTDRNLDWLRSLARPGMLDLVYGDVRDANTVAAAASHATAIYHLAAQVAVTTSVTRPREDFEVNALGTINVLEAARRSRHEPVVVFTSTNKVYGECTGIPVEETRTRHAYRDRPHGVDESQPLDFHSPYGCSKGAADQYVRDHARIYGLPTVVFRMSCIYGPRQLGNEDQGWLAHFLIAAAQGRPITIFGDGKQVRDVLFVDDLVRALRLAVDEIDVTAGQVYNIGGGPANTLAVWSDLGPMIAELRGSAVPVGWGAWRPGDQKVYVSDIRKAARDLGWAPAVDAELGVRRLWDWVQANMDLFVAHGPTGGRAR